MRRARAHFYAGGIALFSPVALFGAGDAGGWWDPSDLSTMFQDSAGTTPVTASGQPVGRINDKSGKGNHLLQATALSRPTYTADASGKYLLFNGHWLRASFAFFAAFDRFTALRQNAWASKFLYDDAAATNIGSLQQFPASPSLLLYSQGTTNVSNGGAAVGSSVVVSEHFAGAASSLTVNNGAPVSGDAGAGVSGGVTVGASQAGTNGADMRWYGAVMVGRALSAPETAQVRSFLGGKIGVGV